MTEKKTFQEKELELLRESVDNIEKTEKKKQATANPISLGVSSLNRSYPKLT